VLRIGLVSARDTSEESFSRPTSKGRDRRGAVAQQDRAIVARDPRERAIGGVVGCHLGTIVCRAALRQSADEAQWRLAVVVARYVYLALAWAFVAGVIVQVFFIGLGLFADPGAVRLHVDFGYILHLFPLLIVLAAAVARAGQDRLRPRTAAAGTGHVASAA
jgi:Family of unknown function (DUF6220)